jgi:CCR4-NOT transcriptional regulation complex NOT5 subunit
VKHDLTTGTWQDDTGCPISIVLAATSDVFEGHGVVNYGCVNFTYEGKQQEEFIEWSEKRIDDELLLSSSSVSSTSPSSSTTTTMTTSSSSSSPPAPANKKRKLNEDVSNVDVSSNDDYSYLSCALGKKDDGFNQADPTIQKIMRGFLAEFIDLLSKDYELNIIDSANNSVSHVRVPKTSSDRSFQNSKAWLDVVIKVAGTKHGVTYEAAYRITNHLLCFYRDSVLAACETQRIPVSKPMSATQFSSTMNASGVSGKGEQEIKIYLKAHLGPGFCPS